MTSRRDSGFTLVELLVVLAIVGMALAVAMPLFARHLGGTTLNTATSELRAALRLAHSTAITEARQIVFRADPAGGYWLDRRHFALSAAARGPPFGFAVRGAERISFYPSGGSSGGRILVTDGSGRREIAIDAVTGRADVR